MRTILLIAIASTFCSCRLNVGSEAPGAGERVKPDLADTTELHLKNLHQLTYGGNNTKPHFSYNHRNVVFQSDFHKWGVTCDQVFIFDLAHAEHDTAIPHMLSTGLGTTADCYFMQDGGHIVYASSHLSDENCLHPIPWKAKNGQYLMGLHDDHDIFVTNLNGKPTEQLTSSPGYDAEAKTSPKGNKIVFTSNRSGDPELYTMNIDGSDVKRITNRIGYDGVASFSPDGSKLVFQSTRPKTKEAIENYRSLLKQGLVDQTHTEIYTCNADGTNLRQVTALGKTNLHPFYHPGGKKIIFSSNHRSEQNDGYQLFTINDDGSNLEQITSESTFNAFPMFSFDGKKLIFCSKRNNGGTQQINIFVADWVD